MGKAKDVRIIINLKCTECKTMNSSRKKKQSIYTTTKNRRNTPERIELKKFCRNCNSHTLHREIK